MPNRSSKRCLLLLAALVHAQGLLGEEGQGGGACEDVAQEDEVTELLQSARAKTATNASRLPGEQPQSTEHRSSEGLLENASKLRGGYLHATTAVVQAALMQIRRTMGRDDSDSGVILLSLVLMLGLLFLILTVWLVRSFSSESYGKSQQDIPFVQPAAALREEALPAISGKFLANTRDQPFTVQLSPIQQEGDWTLDVLSHLTHQPILRVSLCHGAKKLEGCMTVRRSCIQVRSFGGRYRDSLLGSINSKLEIFLPSGEKFGKLVQCDDDSHVLFEESGREPRYSLGLENPSTVSVVWMAKNGPNSEQLREGLTKMGGRHLRHSRKGAVLGSMARPEGSNGDRLELMNIAGADTVLILLCTFGLIAFAGVLDLVDSEKFASEKTGLGWVSLPPSESQTPTARTSLSLPGAVAYQRLRDSLPSRGPVCS
mmetsp:Transcript_55027/g.103110  ORF Transcript_55027/g.103110 Transcript_55027/m.103110 type:complete len:429 (+) Transcript_55027:63-1349(+)